MPGPANKSLGARGPTANHRPARLPRQPSGDVTSRPALATLLRRADGSYSPLRCQLLTARHPFALSGSASTAQPVGFLWVLRAPFLFGETIRQCSDVASTQGGPVFELMECTMSARGGLGTILRQPAACQGWSSRAWGSLSGLCSTVRDPTCRWFWVPAVGPEGGLLPWAYRLRPRHTTVPARHLPGSPDWNIFDCLDHSRRWTTFPASPFGIQVPTTPSSLDPRAQRPPPPPPPPHPGSGC
jgi:hypothetical protein